jgi:hypothetical protein
LIVFESDDIKDARAKESRRKPAERISPREHARILNALQKALERRDRKQYEDIVINGLNYASGSENYVRAMKIWDDLWDE